MNTCNDFDASSLYACYFNFYTISHVIFIFLFYMKQYLQAFITSEYMQLLNSLSF